MRGTERGRKWSGKKCMRGGTVVLNPKGNNKRARAAENQEAKRKDRAMEKGVKKRKERGWACSCGKKRFFEKGGGSGSRDEW